jgi:hypothetical protein
MMFGQLLGGDILEANIVGGIFLPVVATGLKNFVSKYTPNSKCNRSLPRILG